MDRELSNKQYNTAIGLVLLWGFAINAIMCTCFPHVFMTWNPKVILIGYFITGVIGIIMSSFSEKPLTSFIGYNLVVLPIGVVLSVVLQGYHSTSVTRAFISTTIITLTMILISNIKPEIFESMGKTLFICLSGVVVVEFILMITGLGAPQWWDWLVALLFCGYIGYDWSKAQIKPKTLDNAIDSAVDLYLDIVNLFIRILSKKDD